MTPEDEKRYARHLLLPGFGNEAQERLGGSRVLMIGAGGLGSPAALYLTAAGVGQLTIVDFDRVELSNLQRQILHSEDTLGQSKAWSAQERLRALNSQTTLRLVTEPFSLENAMELLGEHDLLLDGSDNFETRYLANDAAFFAGKPLIYGSIFQFDGQMTVFDPAGGGACYRCLVPEMPAEGAVPNCLEAGVIGALPGVIGTLQAMEAIKVLTQLGTPATRKMIYYDGLHCSFREIGLEKDPHCPLCSANPTITTLTHRKRKECAMGKKGEEISAADFAQRHREGLDGILLDVREPSEFAKERIPGSQLVPLGSLSTQLEHLPKEGPIYVHCHSGQRSQKAAKMLMESGRVQVINVQEGIVGWRACVVQ